MTFHARRRLALASSAIALLSACEGGFPDFDLRDLGNGFDTSEAVANLPARPRPDDRGVISYPNYQVVVARQDDTVVTIATRLGLNANELARFNGIDANATLRTGELVALPSRVTEPSPATGAATTGPIVPLDVTAIATSALDRVPAQASTAPAATPAAVTVPAGTEPIRHKVKRGETVFSIARLYNVPVSNIAEWNSLGSDLTIREGQFLLVPQGGGRPPISAITTETNEPGTGSTTPVPPSAATPLPAETPSVPVPAAAVPETPNLGTTPAAVAAPPVSSSSARLRSPVQGTIIRDYAPGKNEGIDIAVPAGTAVKAADSGSVAAVTTDTNGVAIVVIKHADNLLTVYTNLTDLSVEKGASVSRGQSIGKVRAGDPSFVHFETRQGLQSVDPSTLLP